MMLRKIILISWICFIMLQAPKWLGNSNKTETTPTTPQEVKASLEVIVEAHASDRTAMVAQGDIYQVNFGDTADKWRKLADCESGNRDIVSKPNKNGTVDIGRLQINSLWLKVYNLTIDDLLDPDINLQTAKKIYARTNNFNAWTCHNKLGY